AIAATLSIMAIFLPVAFMTGTIGKFFFQFGVTVGVAVFLSLICSLTLTPMLCAFFLNLHEKKPRRPLPFGVPPAALAGLFVVLALVSLRLTARLYPALNAFVWPLADLASWAAELLGAEVPWGDPGQARGMLLLQLSLAEAAAEFAVVALVVRYAN